MLSRSAAVLCALLLLSSLPGCGTDEQAPSDPVPEITGSLQNVEGCKSFTRGGDSSSESCVRFTYDPSLQTLTVTHVNAGFNCCPEKFDVTVTVEDGVIRFIESETGPNCRCNCLYDLDILVEHVPARAYRLVFEEPYRSADEAELNFTVDLTEETSGEHCVPRNMYPWGG